MSDFTTDEFGFEKHPAFGLIGMSRVSSSPPGASLFASDMRHQHSVLVRVRLARRKRTDLYSDHIMADGSSEGEIVEIQMSEAQWASFVSSGNSGDGVPCTIRSRHHQRVPELPFAPRLEESFKETRLAAQKAFAEIEEAFRMVEEKPTKANVRNLRFKIENAPANVEFAGKQLAEHAENVVQKARADIEAMVTDAKAKHQIEAGREPELPAIGDGS